MIRYGVGKRQGVGLSRLVGWGGAVRWAYSNSMIEHVFVSVDFGHIMPLKAPVKGIV